MRPARRSSTAVPACAGRRAGSASGGICSRRAQSTASKTVMASRGAQGASGARRQTASDRPQARGAPAPGSTPIQSPAALRHFAHASSPSSRQRQAAHQAPAASRAPPGGGAARSGHSPRGRRAGPRSSRRVAALERAAEGGEAGGIVGEDLGPGQRLRHPLHMRPVHEASSLPMLQCHSCGIDLGWLSALDLARLIRGKEVSPVEVMTAVLARIDALNPRLNCLLHGDRRGGERRSPSRPRSAVLTGEELGSASRRAGLHQGPALHPAGAHHRGLAAARRPRAGGGRGRRWSA